MEDEKHALLLIISHYELNVRNCYLTIIINGEERMKKFCSENGLVTEVVKRYSSFIQSTLNLQQVWNWVKDETGIDKVSFDYFFDYVALIVCMLKHVQYPKNKIIKFLK